MSKNKSKKQKNSKNNGKISKTKISSNDLPQHFVNLQNIITSLVDCQENFRKFYVSEKQKTKHSINDLTSEISRLKGVISEQKKKTQKKFVTEKYGQLNVLQLKEKLVKTEKNLSDVLIKNHEISTNKTVLEEQNKQLLNDISSLKSKITQNLKAKEETLKNYSAKISSLEKSKKDILSNLKKCKNEISKLKKENTGNIIMIQQLKNENSFEKEDFSKKNKKIFDEKEKLKRELELERERNSEHNKQNDKKIKEKLKEIKKKNKKILTKEKKFLAREKKLNEKLKEFPKLQKEIEKFKEKILEKDKKISILQSWKKKKEKLLKKLSNDNSNSPTSNSSSASLNIKVEKLENDIEGHISKINSLEHNIKLKNKENVEQEKAIKRLEGQLKLEENRYLQIESNEFAMRTIIIDLGRAVNDKNIEDKQKIESIASILKGGYHYKKGVGAVLKKVKGD